MSIEHYVSFSGGKDSTALALLCPDAIPIFADTGWEFDELYAHIDKFEQVTGREVLRIKATESLPDYIARSNFLPGHRARFCTRMFKIEPLEQFFEGRDVQLSIGLRADEDRPGNDGSAPNLEIRYPLQEQDIDIWGVIRICTEHDLLPRYPVYMARGGCKGCFYKRKAEVKAMAQLVPDILDELQELEEGVQDQRGRFAVMFPNTGSSIADIQAQSFMFDPADVYQSAADRSDYGENCGAFCGR